MKVRLKVDVGCYKAGDVVRVTRTDHSLIFRVNGLRELVEPDSFEPISETDEMWEARRYDLAKDIVLSAATNIDYLTEIHKRGWGHTELAQQAVKYADALIEELRKEE